MGISFQKISLLGRRPWDQDCFSATITLLVKPDLTTPPPHRASFRMLCITLDQLGKEHQHTQDTEESNGEYFRGELRRVNTKKVIMRDR